MKNRGMDEIRYKPIGVIHSPFKEPKGTPIQPAGAKDIEGTIELLPEFDIYDVEKTGWLERNVHKLPDARDDERFTAG